MHKLTIKYLHTSVVSTVIQDVLLPSVKLLATDEPVAEDSTTKSAELTSGDRDNLTPSDDASNLYV